MTSKSSSVRSIRLQNEVWERLAVEAAAQGVAVNALVARYVDRGLGGGPVAVPPPAPKPSFSHGRSKTVVTPARPNRIVAGLREAAAGEVATRDIHVEVPVFERKAFNPRPKTGKPR